MKVDSLRSAIESSKLPLYYKNNWNHYDVSKIREVRLWMLMPTLYEKLPTAIYHRNSLSTSIVTNTSRYEKSKKM